MSIWTKLAVVFICAAICALALTVLPREKAVRKTSPPAAPVMLRDRDAPRWLLV
jgi:hypothetical protein